jgi:hypothetical protein
VRGFYFANCNVEKGVSQYMNDDAMAAKLWAISEQLTRDYLPAKQGA